MIQIKYIILFALICAVGFLIFLLLNSENNNIRIDKSFCDQLSLQDTKEICLTAISGNITSCEQVGNGFDILCYGITSSTADLTENLCNSITNNYGKLLCFIQLAMKLKDPKFCMNQEYCYFDLAEKNKNEKFCEFFSGYNSSELTCIAAANDNPSVCDKIENDLNRRICISHVPSKIEDCFIFEYKAFCLTKLAIKFKNLDICKLIQNDNSKFDCFLSVSNNLSICDTVSGVSRDTCLLYYLRNTMRR